MDKTYDPKSIESACYKHWETSGYFSPQADHTSPYCLMMPPPNITGELHMGHAYQHTLMDILVRYHRMKHHQTLWQMGMDHAGIATQMVVERALAKEGQTRAALGREKFLAAVWKWKDYSSHRMAEQVRRMGASVDWKTTRFTLDESLCKAVNHVFIQLYREGIIYRGKRLVNWDPVLQTALSDLEVLNKEEQGTLWHIRYPISKSTGHYLIVATTRPETLLGDTAVAVHPDDTRYQSLIGTTVRVPLTERVIPIIADSSVDPDFGTGCVKITPAHDHNDYAVGQRHQLPLLNLFTDQATLNDTVPAKYQGLDRLVARKCIVKDLEKLGLLEKTQAHKHPVPRGDRSGSIIEPYLTDQWFVKASVLAQPAIQAVREGKITFIPASWDKTYFHWLENIEDWCISRQLWWGHRIPAWHDEAGTIYVGENEEAVRQYYKLSAEHSLTQDPDVLDTWFSSALWPFSTLGWPEKTERLHTFYPTNVLITGYDILFFWVARMVMLGLKFTNQVPFKQIYITGLIRDHHGHKMSKSKGNILDPIDLVDGIGLEKLVQKRTQYMMQPAMAEQVKRLTQKDFPQGIQAYGTDALRFTFCALASTSRDIQFDTNRLSGYRNFCNKLWNAARYVILQAQGKAHPPMAPQTFPDRWIISQLQSTTHEAHQAIEQYRFDWLAQLLYEFVWHTYCDWYLELSKVLLSDTHAKPDIIASTYYTLITVQEHILRLLHPIIPFITETIWQSIKPLIADQTNCESIMVADYPISNPKQIDPSADSIFEWLKTLITQIRTLRSETGIAPGQTVLLYLQKGSDQDRNYVEDPTHQNSIKTLARLSDIQWLNDSEPLPSESAIAFVGKLKLIIPTAGMIDTTSELRRLQKIIDKLKKQLATCQTRLNHADYINKAPAEIVKKERQRVANLQADLNKYESQYSKLKAIQKS